MKEFYVHVFHILFVTSFLGYIGIVRESLPKFLFPLVLVVGIFIVVYHIYKSIFKKDAWINYIHIFIVGPLLVYVGLQKDKTPRKVFEIILMLAFASLGYHGYYMISDQ
jgi:hypothetical protein